MMEEPELEDTHNLHALNSKLQSYGHSYKLERLIDLYYHQHNFDTQPKVTTELPEKRSLNQFWIQLGKELGFNSAISVSRLCINALLIQYAITYLMNLPLTRNSKKLLRILLEHYDPSMGFIKALIQQLIPLFQSEAYSLNSMNVCLHVLNVLFEQQTPTNHHLDSYIQINGGDGLALLNKVRWPFQKSGTITMWYQMSDQTKQSKLFQIINADKVGFEIILKNKKIYFQKITEDKSFRLIKNNSGYLCEAVTGTDVRLCIQFELKKRFFQPAFCINVLMNNFVMNNIEVDSINVNSSNQFTISMFKHFYGKVSSILILTKNLSSQVEELNSQKGFVYENDIKNFAYIFEQDIKHVFLLFSAIRAKTCLKKSHEFEQNEKDLEQNEKSKGFSSFEEAGNEEGGQTIVFDAINRHNGRIGSESWLFRNISIKKQMINYGGLSSYLPFLGLLEKHHLIGGKAYQECLCEFISLIKNMFLNKTESIEEAHRIQFFQTLSSFLHTTQMAGFCEDFLKNIKEMYIALNTRKMRERFIKKLVWNIPAGQYLHAEDLDMFIKFVKGFYNEDVHSMILIFSAKHICHFILDHFDHPLCCLDHSKSHGSDAKLKIAHYPWVLKKYFQIIQTMLLLKRAQPEIEKIVQEIIQMFNIQASACFTEGIISFLSDIFSKDSFIEKIFIQKMQSSSFRMSVFSSLAYSYSWKTKGKLIELILHIYGLKMAKEHMSSQREMIALCLRFPTTSLRMSSIKSEFEKSVDASEDKFSFNSTGVKSFITMKSINNESMTLLNDEEIIKIIWEWSMSKDVLDLLNEENQSPGVSILVELYKGSTYKIRKNISSLVLCNLEIINFTPDLMAWVIECLFICEFDRMALKGKQQGHMMCDIEETKKKLLQLLCSYRIDQFECSDENELYIIKLVLASVKAKYPHDVSKLASLIFLEISEQIITNCLQIVNKSPITDHLPPLTPKVISNSYKCLLEYFTSKGGEDMEFQEDQIEQIEQQQTVILRFLQKLFDLLVNITAPGETKIMSEVNAPRNRAMLELLFPENSQDKVSLMCFIFVCLQMQFECYEDMNISERKTLLLLIKKYLIYLIHLSENIGNLKLQKFEEELKNIFTNALGFLENKFYQYFYYPFERHKHLDYHIQNKLTKNVQDIKQLILNIFIELIQTIKYIDETGSLQHKSFYELMKPKKKMKNQVHVKNFYPACWKKADDKIIQFMSLSVETLKNQAKEKLEMHLIQRRLAAYASSIEKMITIKIQKFIEVESKKNLSKQKNSVFMYLRNETEKCKILTEYEEQITVFMYEQNNRQKDQEKLRKIKHEQHSRQLKILNQELWIRNRIYEGFWTNLNFYQYSQNQGKQPNNELKKYYFRKRLAHQSQLSLTPFIGIQAKPIEFEISNSKSNFEEEIYLVDLEEDKEEFKANEGRKSEKYLRIGLHFLKKRVIEKIMKSSILAKETEKSQQKKVVQVFACQSVILVEPLKVLVGVLKVDNENIYFNHRPSQYLQHISLMKNKQNSSDLLLRKWPLLDIEAYQVKKFMLKLNAIEIFFKNRSSIFLSFYGKAEPSFVKFVEWLTKFQKVDCSCGSIPAVLRVVDPYKNGDKWSGLTEMWKNNEMSNFEYLMSLNILSGRTNCDLNQYFVMPWVLANYESYMLDSIKFRDFDKSMGSLGTQDRLKKFMEIKNNIEAHHKEQFLQSHFYGFHYSNLAIVLQYLIRINPFAAGAMHLQGGKFDIPDRLFSSIPDSYRNATTEMSDVRELIPQFFYFPEFLLNEEDFDFGRQQNKKKVNHVELPLHINNAFEFIARHREELESEFVSSNLHKWIDLIFGYRAYGKEAELAFNKFHYLAYETNAPLIFSEDKMDNKESIESQIAYYGKVPSQLFSKAHPKKNLVPPQKVAPRMSRVNPYLNEEPMPSHLESQMIKHPTGFFNSRGEDYIHLGYSPANKKYICLRRDGKGIIFTIEKSENQVFMPSLKERENLQQNLSINCLKNFIIFLDKFDHVHIFDEAVPFTNIPICSMWSEHLFLGGLWGGKLLKYDINQDKFEFYCKHSDTITAITSSEELQVIISGTVNGEIVIWEYQIKGATQTTSNSYLQSLTTFSLQNSSSTESKTSKMIFRDKIVIHYDRIHSISINEDLKVAISACRDMRVSVIDIHTCEVIRVIKLKEQPLNAVLLTYPFYVYFVSTKNGSLFSISLNGTFLNAVKMSIEDSVEICCIKNFQERVVVKNKKQSCFSIMKVPELVEIERIDIKKQDNNILQFLVQANCHEIQILFTTKSFLIFCSQPLQHKHKHLPKDET